MQFDETEISDTHGVLEDMYTNDVILHCPSILAKPKYDIRIRHEFLKFLGKAQYDPRKPNFVPPSALLMSDETFCKKVARVPVELYNKFLLTV